MGTPYVGEIRIFAGNFAPAGWQFCDGTLLPISENETLFNLIGTTYGGDGQNTFAVPDLRGRLPIHQGQGPGLSTNRVIGETGGVEEVTLSINQIPSHTHPMLASNNTAGGTSPAGMVFGAGTEVTVTAFGSDAPLTTLSPAAVTSVGGSQPHENLQPYLCVNFIISLFGIYPSPT
ncbi:MAG: phage tail protein [Verrucomicrobiaceae bacterium]|nr:phage tail protein [Verrucomicrobiaceae bacterium]